LGWRASAWARRPIRASRRIQAERDAAGFGVAAAQRNHRVQFGILRCSLKNGKSDLEVALPALSRPPVRTVLWAMAASLACHDEEGEDLAKRPTSPS
jgi:hypothetical protein